MTIRWQKLCTNFLFWAIAETTLNFVDLDTIADYSEYLTIKKEHVTITAELSLRAHYSIPDQELTIS
ncbi:hypothetical protein [Pleurocapsa sp. PCC 7319]|uniref:hypothetical protein n=1 Tax=Pleurocapsa sp. PCC 7319 TaxID=118161 RepID=UPI00034AE422|nr:hypothetical protein [Pleurocapsa sp. PCC 7319]